MNQSNNVSQKKVYFWNLMGNLSAAAVSVLYLLIISRLTSAVVADKFSLSYSISNLWVIIGMFQVRNYQGTDVENKYSYTQYFGARIISGALMLLTILPYLLMNDYSLVDSATFVALFIILYRATDAFSDLFQGHLQKYERLDIAGRAMTVRYAGSVLILLVVLLVSKNLVLSTASLFVFNLFFILKVDFQKTLLFEKLQWSSMFSRKNLKGIVEVLMICSPLFINGFLVNLIFNEPKLAIEKGLNAGILANGMQRDYNILFMPAFFMSLCILVIRPLMTDLAKYWFKQQHKQFDGIVQKIFVYLILGGLLITGVAYLIGTPILSIVFGVDLNQQGHILAILVFAGILYSIALVFENLLTIFRYQHYLVYLYFAMFLFSKFITYPLVSSYALLGAGLSFLLTMLLYVIGNAIIYIFVRKKLLHESKREKRNDF